MAQLLPTFEIRSGEFPGNQVVISLPDLSKYEKTFISSDEASGQTVLSVESGINFSADEYIVIGQPGYENSELRLISSAAAGSITVSAATDYAHPRGTIIRFIPFNRINIQNDTDSAFGSATTTNVSLRVDSLETFWEDTDGTSATYYRVRFEHVQGSRQSSWSDGIIATGFADNTVYAVKKRALDSMNLQIGSYEWLTDRWIMTVVNEGRRELESRLDRWSFRKTFDEDIGNVVQGTNSLAVPSTLRESETAKNLLGVRIGKDGRPLDYIDQKKMKAYYEGTANTTLSSSLSASATTAALTNSRDFTRSGSVIIAGAPTTSAITGTIDPDGTTTATGVSTLFTTELHVGDILIVNTERRTVTAIASATSLTVGAAFTNGANDTSPDAEHPHYDTVDYTDNDITNNTLRGVTNIQQGGHANSVNVWQGITPGLPTKFTVTDNGIIFDKPFHGDYQDENVFADFWSTFTDVNSDADTFDEPDYDMFVNYVAYRIKKKKNRGEISPSDDDFLAWLNKSAALIARENLGQNIEMYPANAHLDDE